jgi:hypothetical protein
VSPAPGHSVTIGSRPAATQAAPSTANGFMVGYTEKGSDTEPVLVVSPADAQEKLGGRVADAPTLYDALDVAFREGASHIYVGRIVGTGAKAASEILVDSESKKVLKVSAKSKGAWGNNLKAKAATSGEGFILTIELSGSIVETSPLLATSAEAVEWAKNSSKYVTIEAESESTKDPKEQTIELKSGDDKHGSANTANLETSIALFTKDLGPGQVSAPGFTSEAVQKVLLAHATANNRRALLDDPDGGSASTISGHAIALRSVPNNGARFGTMLAPWAVVPGLSSSTTRTVPYSAVQTGLIARAEAEGRSPNEAVAGKLGKARYATGLTASFTDAQLEELNNAGVIAAKLVRGVPTTFGDRTLTNATTDSNWRGFAASRCIMAVAANAGIVMENFDFAQIDGHGYIFKKLEGALKGEACMPLYLADALYGQTPDEAFQVNTGPDVNTPATIAAGEIKAQITLRVSPSGEFLTTEIVKVATTEALV